MKFRTGFVSNSSSSSFLIFGVEGIPTETFVAGVNRLITTGKIKGRAPLHDWYEAGSALGILVEDPWGTGELYVGLSWDQIGDKETGAEFKARAKALVNAALPDYAEDLKTLEASWYA